MIGVCFCGKDLRHCTTESCEGRLELVILQTQCIQGVWSLYICIYIYVWAVYSVIQCDSPIYTLNHFKVDIQCNMHEIVCGYFLCFWLVFYGRNSS